MAVSIWHGGHPTSVTGMADDREKPPRRVFVRDLEILASVGIFEVEVRYEQRIIVALEVDVIDSYDGVSERIGDVYDYGKLVRDTEILCQSRHFKLIETLAEAIAGQCLADTRVLAVAVQIEKPDIMTNCRAVGIEIRRSRREGPQVQCGGGASDA
jgi:7,8-dihydroneopterin aldolase/epimerase/oxygenase